MSTMSQNKWGSFYHFLSKLTIGLLTAGMLQPVIFLWGGCAIAQVTSDGTTNTTVNQSGNNFNILNGVDKGNNLFHSFSNFSVPTGGSANFDLINTPNITTIFSRVTGGNVSNIDGLIQTLNSNNPVSLFLMNPNGIVFGQNASLNIGGSFVGTTANSIKFADGVEFSAVNTQTNPLLSINVPIGLQMGNNPSPIQIQGTGYSSIATIQLPTIRNPSPTKLQVQPGTTLALVGGNISLNGATLTAEQGQIELGSLGGVGLISLLPTTQGYKLKYGNEQSFGDIQLAQKSLLDVSGVNSGDVQLQGRNIDITDGSMILSQNFGYLPSGDIRLQASERISVIGTTPDGKNRSSIRSEAFGAGASANISIVSPQLTLKDSSIVNTITFGAGNSGKIEINAADIEMSDFLPLTALSVVNISATTYGTGTAGDISIDGNNLLLSGGAGLSSVTFSQGSSGTVTIHNQKTTVTGKSPFDISSAITSTTFGTGNTQDLILNTGKLEILNGGLVGSSALLIGNAGNISINATEEIIVSGSNQNTNSSIRSSSVRLSPQLRQVFDLPDILTANSGSVNITTPNLILTDGGTVSVTSQGTGTAGNLNITADNIQLKNQSLIQAATESGNGGNINLNVGSLSLLRDRSQITATAGGNGNGGNININVPILVGLENSDIIANAVQGKGGNINIKTQGIIGLEFRNTLSPREEQTNDITASSEFNINGTVEINNVGVDPNSGLIELPENITDSSQQIATGCSTNQGSSFVATGRGGIPENPSKEIGSDVYDGLRLRTWFDIRDLSAYRKVQTVQTQIPTSPETMVQATSWRRNAQGKVELIAAKSVLPQPLTCAGVPKN